MHNIPLRLGGDGGCELNINGSFSKIKGTKKWLWLFQDIIMWPDATKQVIIPVNFKGKPIEHINACFPAVFMPFYFFDSEGGWWMSFIKSLIFSSNFS